MSSLLFRNKRASAARARRKLGQLSVRTSSCESLEDRTLLTTFGVLHAGDNGPGSLRAAIESANTNPGADVIEFAAGVEGTVSLSTGELAITDDLTINGPGAGKLSVDGSEAGRVFAISGDKPDVTITGLTVAGGRVIGSEALGAGILNHGGNLTLRDMVFAGNDAIGEGRRDAIAGGGAIANIFGATLTIGDSTFIDNHASGTNRAAGGAILNDADSNVILERSSFSENTATGLYLDHNRLYGGNGGAIANMGASTASISYTTFTANQALGRSGKDVPGQFGGSAAGGAIANAPSLIVSGHVNRGPVLNIVHSTFLANQAIAGDGSDAVDGVSAGEGGFGFGGAIENDIGGTVSIADSLFQANLARGGDGGNSGTTAAGGQGHEAGGGAILNTRGPLTVVRTDFIDNQAIGGLGGSSLAVPGGGGDARGGVMHAPGFVGFVQPGPQGLPPVVTFTDVTFQGNTAIGGTGGHGGAGQGGKGGFARGGALSTNESTLNVLEALFDGNQAVGGSGGSGGTLGNGGNGYGGAISNGNEIADAALTANWLTVADSRLTDNRAVGGGGTVAGSGFGGALMNGSKAEASVSNTIFTQNAALGGSGVVTGGNAFGGAIYNRKYSQLTLIGATVTTSAAIGGDGGGEDGAGVAGGVYSESGGFVYIDTLDAIFANSASTEGDDWFGMLIVF